MLDDPTDDSMKSLKPSDVETRVSISKWNGHTGNFTRRRDRLRRLHMMKQEDLGIEKQRSPLEDERRLEEGGHVSIGGVESDMLHHEFMTVL